jgi:hypothetical protein
MPQRRDPLDELLADADATLGAGGDDLDALLADADAVLATPPAAAPASRAPASRVVTAPGRIPVTPRLPHPVAPGVLEAELDIVASSPASQSRRGIQVPRTPIPAGPTEPTLAERLATVGDRGAGALPPVAFAKGAAGAVLGAAANTAGTLAAGAYARGPMEAQALTAPARQAAADFAPSADAQPDVLDDPGVLVDPEWWGYMAGQLTGSVASLAGTGGAGRTLGAAAAGKLALRNPALAARLANLGGEAAAAAGEAMLEASDAYTGLVQQGATPEEAAAKAAGVFSGNVALLGLTNHPLFEAGGRGVVRIFQRAASESTQEVGQTALSNVAQGRELTEGMGTAAVMGALGGPAIGAALDVDAQGRQAPPVSPTGRQVTPEGIAPPDAQRTRVRGNVAASAAARAATNFPPAAPTASPAAAVSPAPVPPPAPTPITAPGSPSPAPPAPVDQVLAEADEILGTTPDVVQAPADPVQSVLAEADQILGSGEEQSTAPGPVPPAIRPESREEPPAGTVDLFGNATEAPTAAGSVRRPAVPIEQAGPGDYSVARPQDIDADPARFQFKGGADAAGVTSEGRLTEGWNENRAGQLLVWRDPANGRLYVVNGHHRLERAKRDGAERIAVKLLESPTAEEARVEGALTNIAEEKGTALDVAKLVRDAGFTRQDLAAAGVPARSSIARDGLALAGLNDVLFQRTAIGEIDLAIAIAVGSANLTPEAQQAVITLAERQAAKGKALTPAQVRVLAEDAAQAPQVAQQGAADGQMSIFGDVLGEEREQSVAVERAVLREWLGKELAKDRRLFGYVSKGKRAEDLARGGNVIDRDSSKAIADEAARMEAIVAQLAQAKGPISDALNAAAVDLAQGGRPDAVRSTLLDAVRAAVQAELAGGAVAQPGPPPRGADPAPDAGAAGRGGGASAPPRAERRPPDPRPDRVAPKAPIPRAVVRHEEQGAAPSSVSKPQGLYTTPADVESPHADLGGARTEYSVNPDARVLSPQDYGAEVVMRRGASSAGTGVHVARELLGADEFARLKALRKPELIEEAKKIDPAVEWHRYYDAQEVMEGIGGVLARRAGYDALWLPDAVSPAFSEFVALTDRAFLAAADTLDTGEQQPRLAGDVGAVREVENPTPQEELPEQSLILRSESVRDLETEQAGLFGPGELPIVPRSSSAPPAAAPGGLFAAAAEPEKPAAPIAPKAEPKADDDFTRRYREREESGWGAPSYSEPAPGVDKDGNPNLRRVFRPKPEGDTFAPELRDILDKAFPNFPRKLWAVERPGVLVQQPDPALGDGRAFHIDLTGDKPVVTVTGGKDRQISNLLTEVFTKTLRKHPNLRELVGGAPADVVPVVPKKAAAPKAEKPAAPVTPKERTPGTRVEWGTVQEWIAGAEAILGRRVSSGRYAAEREHLAALSNEWIEAQPVADLRELATWLEDRASQEMKPIKGRREGTDYERVINALNNAIARGGGPKKWRPADRTSEKPEAPIAPKADTEFRRWFGASKVVDAAGAPRVVYHGTLHTITDGVFRVGERGIFFTDDPDIAGDVYALAASELNEDGLRQAIAARSVTELVDAVRTFNRDRRHETIDRVFEAPPEDMTEAEWREELARDVTRHLFDEAEGANQGADAFLKALGVEPRTGRRGSQTYPVYLSLQNPLEVDAKGEEFDRAEQTGWVEQAKAGGHDGVIVRNYDDGGWRDSTQGGGYRSAGRHTVYIAFEPEQVRTAVGPKPAAPVTPKAAEPERSWWPGREGDVASMWPNRKPKPETEPTPPPESSEGPAVTYMHGKAPDAAAPEPKVDPATASDVELVKAARLAAENARDEEHAARFADLDVRALTDGQREQLRDYLTRGPELPEQAPRVFEGDIPIERAQAAHAGTSWTPEVRAQQERRGYVDHMQAVWTEVRRRTQDQVTALRAFEDYRRDYLARYLRVLGARSRVMSAMIAGPSKFPTARNAKRSDTYEKALREFVEWDRKARGRLIGTVDPQAPRAISADREDAVEALEEKVRKAEQLQDLMKEANLIVRRSGPEDAKIRDLVKVMGVSEKAAKALLEPDFMGRKGFPDFELRNNLANIRRMQGRIAEIRANRATPEGAATFEGGRVEEDARANRIRVHFDAKPDQATREKLRGAGFKWAPSEGAWQRQRTDNARAAVERLLGVTLEAAAAPPSARDAYEEAGLPEPELPPDPQDAAPAAAEAPIAPNVDALRSLLQARPPSIKPRAWVEKIREKAARRQAEYEAMLEDLDDGRPDMATYRENTLRDIRDERALQAAAEEWLAEDAKHRRPADVRDHRPKIGPDGVGELPIRPKAPAPSRAELIDRIVGAVRAEREARQGTPVERFELLYSDGKWRAGDPPLGVTYSGERRSVGWAIRAPEGTVHGARYPTREALVEAMEQRIAEAERDMRADLETRDDASLQEAADYWLRPKAQPLPPITPRDRRRGNRAKGRQAMAELEGDRQALRNAGLPKRGSRRASRGPQQRRPGTAPIVPKGARPSEIVDRLKTLFDVPVRERRLGVRAWGWYAPKQHLVRTKIANDLPVLAHEFGHVADSLMRLNLADPQWAGELRTLGLVTSAPSYSAKEVREEGMAEFFRLWLMEPTVAQQQAPAFFAEFERQLGTLTIGKELREVQKLAQAYLAADPVARVKARIDFDGKGTTPIDSWLARAAERWTDDLFALQRAVTAMAGGNPLPASENAYTLARVARGAPARAAAFLDSGVRDLDGQFIAGGASLRAALADVERDLDEFAVYLVAKRAHELHGRGIETGFTDAEIGRGPFAQGGAIEAIEQGPKGARFKAAAAKVYAYQDALLQYARQSGALDSQAIAAMKAVNQLYVPFQRVLDAAQELKGGGTAKRIADRTVPIKRIKGSGRDIINPLESIVRNTFLLVDMVEKNRAMAALASMVDERKDTAEDSGRFLMKVPGPQAGVGVKLGEVITEALIKAGTPATDPTVADLIDAMANAGLDADQVLPLFQNLSTGVRGEQILTVIRKGQREHFQVQDPMLYRALTMIGPTVSELAQIANVFTGVLRAGATLTTGFIARNPARDTLSAYLQSRHGFLPVYDTVRGMVKLVLHEAGLRADEDVDLFFASGAAQAAMVGADRDRVREELRRATRSRREALADTVIHPLGLINVLRAVSEFAEAGSRIGEFSLALEQGGEERGIIGRVFGARARAVNKDSLAVAALAARDVTTDFSRGGNFARELNAYSAFFNARLQGYVRIAETIKRNPAVAVEKIATMAALSLALYALHHDDDDYNEIEPWERQAYWHWKPEGWDRFLRFPKPFEWAFVPNLAEAAAMWALERDPRAWLLARQQLTDNARQFAYGFVPTFLLPPLETAMNYSTYRQRPIVPWFNEDLPLEQQADDWTTETAKWLTRHGFPMAPAKIDHLLFGYTAGLGRATVDTAIDPVLRVTGQAPAKATQPADRAERMPILGVYQRSAAPTASAPTLVAFYEAFDEMQGYRSGARKATAAQNFAQRDRIAADAGGKVWRGREAEMRAAKKRIDELADLVDAAYGDRTMSAWEKRTALDGYRRAMVYEAARGLGWAREDHVRRRSNGSRVR